MHGLNWFWFRFSMGAETAQKHSSRNVTSLLSDHSDRPSKSKKQQHKLQNQTIVSASETFTADPDALSSGIPPMRPGQVSLRLRNVSDVLGIGSILEREILRPISDDWVKRQRVMRARSLPH